MDDLFTHAGAGRQAETILLDYQCTLVANGADRIIWRACYGRSLPYTDWIAQEVYRAWLLPLLAGRRVVLITARPARYEVPTLARIRAELGGWQPDEWHFNPWGLPPPACKRRTLHDAVFPRHGAPDRAAYLALESNAATRAMYRREGIHAVRLPETEPWTSLPLIPEA